jgi:diguanylate cyclase (GGDEF)-like protein/PAS domain S-box-containing protein
MDLTRSKIPAAASAQFVLCFIAVVSVLLILTAQEPDSAAEIKVLTTILVASCAAAAAVSIWAILTVNRDNRLQRQIIATSDRDLSLLASTFEATADGILAVDLDNRIVAANRKFVEMWSVPFEVPLLPAKTDEIVAHVIGLLKDPADLAHGMERSRQHPEEISQTTLALADGKIYERHTQPQVADGRIIGRVMSFRDITERSRTEEILLVSEERYRLLFDRSPYPVWVFDTETLRFLAVNAEAVKHYGYTREEFLRLTIKDIRPADEISKLVSSLREESKHSEVVHNGRHQKKDGTIIDVEVAAQSIAFDGKRARIALVTDVTERKRADAALRESEQRFRTLLESMSEGLLQVDADDRILFVNNTICQMVGYTQEELVGTDWSRLLLDEGPDFVNSINRRRRRGTSDRYEIKLRKKSGETLWVIVGGAPILNAEGCMVGSLGVFTDITDRKRTEEQLLHDAFHDGLTGLANRSLFMDHLRLTIERGRRGLGTLYGVLFLDFDRFKVINDSLGHAEGDNLLKLVAKRLEASLRPGDLIARLGGDEFTILLNELADEADARRIAERIQNDLKAPFKLSGREIFISVSIGIALSTSRHDRAEDMVRDADIAMYEAKARGKAQHQVFDHEMRTRAVKQLEIETEMRYALERGEFRLHYQPIMDIRSRNLVGFEALIRWEHPVRGIIPPSEFIPIAEENNLIIPLGRWTVYESCRQMKEWQKRDPRAENLAISVNLSCKEFLQNDLADHITAALVSTNLEARCLKLEITESHIMENSELAVAIMNRLRALGVEMSLDDFGTGYSSLSYLHRLPVNYLKIDRSFVRRMVGSDEHREIVHTIVKLAQNLRMKVVAEGIETSEQLFQLNQFGCELGQGYLFSKPLDPAAAGAFASEHIQSDYTLIDQTDPVLEFSM